MVTTREARKDVYCDHCDDVVSHATYYRHRRLRSHPAVDETANTSSSDSEAGIDTTECDQGPSEGNESFDVLQEDVGETSSLESSNSLSSDSDSDFSVTDYVPELAQVLIDTDDDEDDDDDLDNETVREDQAIPVPIRVLMIFLLLWQAFFTVSDAGLAMSIVFFHHFFRLLASMDTSSVLLTSIASHWPKSASVLNRIMSITSDRIQFTRYVVCPKCDSIYRFSDCITSSKNSKTCRYIPFPNHPQQSKRKACGTVLLRTVTTRSGKVLRPRKEYCYQSLTASLRQLLSRPGYLELCENWRSRSTGITSDYLGDIYDGRIWQEYQYVNGQPFLALPHNLVLSLNVDWFGPFKHTTYSVGAIYIIVQNLPRNLRFKPENAILCGIIPGPKEPKHTIASYLAPLVDELAQLWQGVKVDVKRNGSLTIRAALLCSACDLPATRKVLGFSSYNSYHGCSKCKHRFPRFSHVKKHNYSDFNWQNWELRDLTSHRQACNDYLTAKTKSDMARLIAAGGVRYTPLLNLPYFDPIRYHVVDPMHNLLLGTAKHVMEIWIEKGILNKKMLEVIEAKVQCLHAPVDVGRIPTKIASGFSGFKADQWRNWTLLFSAVALKNVIGDEHLRCWLLFVKACHILCNRVIRRQEVDVAHAYLVLFCRTFAQLYGEECCSPNQHMHLHLKDSLLDYGPSYSFWCFSFERYNGILGNYQTNNRAIESQIMRKFLKQQQIRSIDLPNFSKEIHQLLSKMISVSNSGSLETLPIGLAAYSQLMELKSIPLSSFPNFQCMPELGMKLLPPVTEYVLSLDQVEKLGKLFSELRPGLTLSPLLHLCRRSARACIAGEVLGSQMCRSDRSSCIAARWPSLSQSSSECELLTIGIVNYFIEYTVVTSEHYNNKYIFAYVSWFSPCPQREFFGSSAVVSYVTTQCQSQYSFIPVQRISNRCTHGTMNINFLTHHDRVSVAVPMDHKCCF